MNFKFITILIIMCFNIWQMSAQTNVYSNSLNNYSFDLFHKTKVEKENLILSPLSTYYALLLAYEGSKNKTKQEFEKVLYLESTDSLKNNYLHNIASKLDSYSGINFSNAIWLDKSLQVEEGYRNSVSDKYFSDFKRTKFANTESAVSDINEWVSEKTHQRINEIVKADNIHSDTKLLISNTIYFKGEWLNKFEVQKTNVELFYATVENQYKVDFMKKTERLQYFENEEYQFISKLYKDSNMSFCIILPKKLFGIEEIEKKMNTDFFNEILDSTYYTNISLSIPKLKLKSSYELSNALKNAGLKYAFTNETDFSGITKEVPLKLDQILHKTYIELDEEKTEATAATVAAIKITGIPSYKTFKADHPFIFFIIDNSTRTILFIGRFMEPVSGEKILNTASINQNLENRRKAPTFVDSNSNNFLFLVDNKITSSDNFYAINPKDIKSMTVTKNKEDISKYSSCNYDGIIVITLKKKWRIKKRNK